MDFSYMDEGNISTKSEAHISFHSGPLNANVMETQMDAQFNSTL